MAAVRHFGFWKLAVFVMWPLSACRSASWCKISLISDNRLMSYGQKGTFKMSAVAISNLKLSIFGHVTVIGFNIWCSVPNFIKIGRFFTEIWRYNDFQNGGRPPPWILKICSFVMSPLSACRSASANKISPKSDNRSMSYGQKTIFKMAVAAMLNSKNFNFWSRDCNRVQYLM